MAGNPPKMYMPEGHVRDRISFTDEIGDVAEHFSLEGAEDGSQGPMGEFNIWHRTARTWRDRFGGVQNVGGSSTVKRVLVTGAGGFVGRHTFNPLRALGFEVHGVLMPGEVLDSCGVITHGVDLLDPHEARQLLCDVAPSHLLHLAWCTEHGEYWEAQDNLDWVAASLLLARSFAEHGGKRMVMVGSCAEYSWPTSNGIRQGTNILVPLERSWGEGGVRKEIDPPSTGEDACENATCIEGVTSCNPETLYGISKHVLHKLISEFNARVGVSGAWARVFYLYGPGEDPRRLVASVILSLLSGEVADCTHGEQVRDFLHVADAGSALAALVDSSVEGPVNVASGNGTPVRELLSMLGKHLGRGDLIRFGAKSVPPGDPPVLVADTRRLNDEVGWEPAMGLETGLEATVTWWRNRLEGRES